MHGLFSQYQVGPHSYERVDFLMFENQYHPLDQPKETREREISQGPEVLHSFDGNDAVSGAIEVQEAADGDGVPLC